MTLKMSQDSTSLLDILVRDNLVSTASYKVKALMLIRIDIS